MIGPVMLQACVNGARRPLAGVALPVTPGELAEAAVAAVDAGADGLHLHPKDGGGADTLDPRIMGAAVAAVRRAVPGVQIGVTTGAWAVPDPNLRLRLVAAWRLLDEPPDVASVNWHEQGAAELAALLLDGGIGVEAGLWTTSAARAFRAWPRAGEVTRVLVESTVDDARAAPFDAGAILAELRAGHPSDRVLVHGEGTGAWPVLDWAAARGLAVRIGLEDVLTLPDGSPATSNAQLVAGAVTTQPLRHNTVNPVTATVDRIHGPGSRTRIRKRLSRSPLPGRPGGRHGTEQRHAAYWAREAEAYRDAGLQAGLREAGLDLADACVVDTPDGATLWLEDVQGRHGADFTLADHRDLARALGRWQARPRPLPAWASSGWLLAHLGWRLGARELALLADDDAWALPLIRETWPPALRDGWRRLVAGRERLLDALDAAPRCLAHLDLWVANVVRRADGRFVLLDWAHAGDGAVGEDAGNHVPDAFLDLFTPVALLGELDAAVTDGYLLGLREGGADDVRVGAARLAMRASAVKYAWLVPVMLRQAGANRHRAYFAEVDTRELYVARGLVFEHLVAWADEALGRGT